MGQPEPHSPEPGKTDPVAEAAELRSRLEALKVDLGDAVASEKAESIKSSRGQSSGGALGVGMRAGSELTAGVLVGCGIGYLIDRLFDTSPLFLIIFMMFGMATGFWNVYRIGMRKSVTPDGSGK
jgi:ATP synthase protein I